MRLLSLTLLFSAAFFSPSLYGQQVLTTMAGTGTQCGASPDGVPATSASLCTAAAPVTDGIGNVYFFHDHKIRRVTSAGIIETIAGTGEAGNFGDGGPALFATIGWVSQMALYADFLIFTDENAHKVRAVVLSSGMIYGWGTGNSAYAGDGGPLGAASFQSPSGVAVDEMGNIYIADSAANVVRKADAASGNISTLVGPGPGYTGGPLGDGGPALGANILSPRGLYYRNGVLYISDLGNGRVRRVTLSTGIIDTVSTGAGYHLAGDSAGNLYVSGVSVTKINPSGIGSTVVGILGTSGYGADDVLATDSPTGGVTGLFYDELAKRLLVVDAGSRVRQIFFTPPTTTSLQVNPNPANFGGTVTLEATVTPADAIGNVRFYAQGALLGSVPLSAGVASYQWTAPLGGVNTQTMAADYGGDPTHNLSRQAVPLTLQFPKSPSTTSLGASTAEAAVTETVIFTANVSPSTASGNVAFRDNGSTIGTVALNSGTAVFSTILPQGPHSIAAFYAGNSVIEASNSAPVTVTVKAIPSLSWSTSPNPSLLGQAVTMTAQITPATATGQIQFRDNGAIIGAAALVNGTAVLNTATLTLGPHEISLTYSGDANVLSANTSSITHTVVVNSSVSLASSLNPSLNGQAVQFTATVTPSNATGTVQFRDGAIVLGQATVSGGVATLAVSSLAVGSHSIQAFYGGNGVVLASNSSVLTQVVKTATTTNLTSSKNPQTKNKPITFTATVSVPSAPGTVEFRNGTAVLGTATIVNGSASLTVTAGFNSGTYPITAVYSGNATYAGSTSSVLTQTVR